MYLFHLKFILNRKNRKKQYVFFRAISVAGIELILEIEA